MAVSSDRIEKKLLLRAPQERVWQAITEAKPFGYWFGVDFDGEFALGAELTGRVVPTKVDPEVAKMQKQHEGMTFELHVDRIEPMRLFAFRWHPFAIEKGVDYSKEPMTTVTFVFQPDPGGTMLTIIETGFDRLPLARRSDAYEANTEGWTAQGRLLQKYVAT